MNVNDIVGMNIQDFNKLTNQELLQASNVLTSAVNKRIRRLSANAPGGVISPAVRSLAESQGIDVDNGELPRFSTQGLRGQQSKLRSYLSNLRNFITMKTASVKGFKEYRKEVKNVLPESVYGDRERESAFWRGYTRFMQEEHKEMVYSSEQVVSWLRENVKDGEITPDSINELLLKADERGYIGNEEMQNFNELIPTDGDLPF